MRLEARAEQRMRCRLVYIRLRLRCRFGSTVWFCFSGRPLFGPLMAELMHHRIQSVAVIRHLVYSNNRTLARRLYKASSHSPGTEPWPVALQQKEVSAEEHKAGSSCPCPRSRRTSEADPQQASLEKAPLYLTAAVQDLIQSLLVAAAEQIPNGKSRINRGSLKALRSNKDLAAVLRIHICTTPVKIAANSIVSNLFSSTVPKRQRRRRRLKPRLVISGCVSVMLEPGHRNSRSKEDTRLSHARPLVVWTNV